MNRRFDKPSGIPKPASGIAGAKQTGKTMSTNDGKDAKLPLSKDVTNLLPRKRAPSPDLPKAPMRNKLRRSRSFNDIRDVAVPRVNPSRRIPPTLAPIPDRSVASSRTGAAAVKLRRSRSYNDIRDIAVSRVNPLKRTAPPLASIPAKRVAPAPRMGASAPAAKSTVKSTVQTGAVSKVGAKKIPPYDYKARYGALLEKHNTLKAKFDEYREQLGHMEGLPEQYEESQADVQRLQHDLSTVKSHNECLERETKESAKKIHDLTTKLEMVTEQLEKVTQTCQAAQAHEKELLVEVDELKTSNKFLNDEVDSMKEEMTYCKDQLFASVMEKKDLHNQMMDLRGNIRVFCRVRPQLLSEQEKTPCGWKYIDEASLEITSLDPKNKNQRTEFSFDHVFHPLTSQTDVFDNVTPLLQSALDGYNVCIFAYGQTGSGKTFTMEGHDNLLGVIPRTVDLLFETVTNYRRIGWEYQISVTFLEIYNEVLYDLLNPHATDLEIRMVSKNSNDIYVSNITEKTVQNGQELKRLMEAAKRNRATACTVGNERSSRSHAITRIQLMGVHAGKQEKCVGAVNLVDLAGSESPKTSTRMEETKNINRSLSELTNVIMAILSKQEHVPYRNSKLTHLLMPALGGNSKTLMVINVSPLQDCYSETMKSLRFASSVNNIKMTKVRKNRTLNVPPQASTSNS